MRERDARLIAEVDAALAEAARRAGTWLACRPGCIECCLGPFPISMLDAWRLREGLALLHRTDPARAAAVLTRAARAKAVLSHGFPGDSATGLLADSAQEDDSYFNRHGNVPCPLLDPVTLGCDLYAWRPLSCRTFGPPVTIGGEDLAPCHLCFVGAPASEIERCRVCPDPEAIEDELLEAIERAGAPRGQTLVAHALLQRT